MVGSDRATKGTPFCARFALRELSRCSWRWLMKFTYTNCDAEIKAIFAARPRKDFTPVVTITGSQGLRTLILTSLYFSTREQAELYGMVLTRKWIKENSAEMRRKRTLVEAADPAANVRAKARRKDRAPSQNAMIAARPPSI